MKKFVLLAVLSTGFLFLGVRASNRRKSPSGQQPKFIAAIIADEIRNAGELKRNFFFDNGKGYPSVIDSLTLFNLLKHPNENTLELLYAIHPQSSEDWKEYKPNTSLVWYYSDFCFDTRKEVILHFNLGIEDVSWICILTPLSGKYRVSEPLAYEYGPANIDLKNKLIVCPGRMWGTCDEGSSRTVYAYREQGFKELLYFVQYHAEGECMEDEADEGWSIETKHRIVTPDSIVVTGKANHDIWPENRDPNRKPGEKHHRIRMAYKYDAVKDTFYPYNQQGKRLSENPTRASEFWDLIEKKEL